MIHVFLLSSSTCTHVTYRHARRIINFFWGVEGGGKGGEGGADIDVVSLILDFKNYGTKLMLQP